MSQTIAEAPTVVGAINKPKSLPTIWNVPDDLWETMQRVLTAYDPPPVMGRPRIDQRKALDGIIYRARTGCQWNHLPKEFGDDVSVHRTMQRWESKGVFDILWAVLLIKCEELRGVDWDWQSADCALGKAPRRRKKGASQENGLGGGENGPSEDQAERVCDAKECVGKNPTDRAKQGVKRSLLVEGGGGPLGIVIAGANVPDAQLLKATIEAVVVKRPLPTQPQHLCLDKGYDNAPAEAVVTEAGYVPHIRRIGEEKKDGAGQKTHPARRWVVERTFAWLSRWRGILIRWEKKADNYLATLKLSCALIWYRKCHTLD